MPDLTTFLAGFETHLHGMTRQGNWEALILYPVEGLLTTHSTYATQRRTILISASCDPRLQHHSYDKTLLFFRRLDGRPPLNTWPGQPPLHPLHLNPSWRGNPTSIMTDQICNNGPHPWPDPPKAASKKRGRAISHTRLVGLDRPQHFISESVPH